MGLKSEFEFHVMVDANDGALDRSYQEMMNDFQTELFATFLLRTNGNKAKAAELLKMNRTTLVERCKSLGIEWRNGDIVIKGA